MSKATSKAPSREELLAKVDAYHQKREQQPGMPINVPQNWSVYCIPADIPEDRRRPLRFDLEDRGYVPLSAAIEGAPELERVEHPTLPGAEIWVIPAYMALAHHERRKQKHAAAKSAVGGRRAGAEGSGAVMEQRR